ncbi:hypothetical protein NBRC3257_1862 [Gluconobacter thailandicus NBRC 3257]|uniref:Transposase n=1 Tax=Gluconobacter thailandicus NBRC 3257 TaxID=1381097 RepID=A0ABQ0IXE2_GLUTH|nr:hypothetical protein NBRC3257_1862 [Gluconobacter thailandicus NBRC 3257]
MKTGIEEPVPGTLQKRQNVTPVRTTTGKSTVAQKKKLEAILLSDRTLT